MLVKDFMTRHPIMIASETSAAEAEKIMSENGIRHIPVVGDGKRLEGLITRERLTLKPDALASLDVWEISRYVADLTVKKLMLKVNNVHTIEPTKTVERAAQIMTEHKVSCLPVIEDGLVVGILTEIDLLRTFQELLGLSTDGVRVTVRTPNRIGEFAKLSVLMSEKGWAIMGVGSFSAPRTPGFYYAVLKIAQVSIADVEALIDQIPEQEIVDIREVV